MTVGTSVEIVGIREAVASLNKIQPGLRKEFAAELNRIAAPALSTVRGRYGSMGLPLPGMGKVWTQNGRKLFPYDVAKAQKGVQVKLDTRKSANSVIVVRQMNQAAAIYETAGRKNPNALDRNLGRTPKAGRTRLFGPAVYSQINAITKGIETAALQVVNRVNRELR